MVILLLFSLLVICPYHRAKMRMKVLTGSCAGNLNARTGTIKNALKISSAKESELPTEGSGFAVFNINIHVLNSLTYIPYIQCLKDITSYFISGSSKHFEDSLLLFMKACCMVC